MNQKKRQLGVTKEQEEELKERTATEQAGVESALRGLYAAIWLLKPGEGENRLTIERVEAGGRPLQSTGIHDRMLELLTTVQIRVFATIRPRRILELLKLGEPTEDGLIPKVGIRASEIVDAFYGIPGYPRLLDASAIRKALCDGVAEGLFAYSGRGEPPLSGQLNERSPVYQVRRDQVVIGRRLADDEINLDDGFIILPQGLLREPGIPVIPPILEPPIVGPGLPSDTPPTPPEPGVPLAGQGPTPEATTVRLTISLNRPQLFASFNAFGNLVDKGGTAKLTVEVTIPGGVDKTWLRNAVLEPLEEAGVRIEDQT